MKFGLTRALHCTECLLPVYCFLYSFQIYLSLIFDTTLFQKDCRTLHRLLHRLLHPSGWLMLWIIHYMFLWQVCACWYIGKRFLNGVEFIPSTKITLSGIYIYKTEMSLRLSITFGRGVTRERRRVARRGAMGRWGFHRWVWWNARVDNTCLGEMRLQSFLTDGDFVYPCHAGYPS